MRMRRYLSVALGGQALPQDMSRDERRKMWPPAPDLEDKHLKQCRVVPNRVALLDHMPKAAICAEVGIMQCEFSRSIMHKLQPAKCHLIDIDPKWIGGAKELFADEVKKGRVQLHTGDSATILSSMPKEYFDWVYIDGDHSYEGVKRDLEATRQCIKPGALIALNDYTFWSVSGFCKYGVMEAVNEFCLTYDFEFMYFALQGRGYHDVVLRQIGSTPSSRHLAVLSSDCTRADR